MKIINNHQAQTELIEGMSVIIDVREPQEYEEIHIPGALNIPSTQYTKNSFLPFQDLKVCLVCQSGARAKQVNSKLIKDGFDQAHLLEFQMENVQSVYKNKGWSVDRQFRMTLGAVLLLFLVLYYFDIKSGIILPIILSAGLIITSIIDRCYMRIGIAKLPWNRGKTIPK